MDLSARVPVFSGWLPAMPFQLRMGDDFKSHPELATATRWDSPQGMASQMHTTWHSRDAQGTVKQGCQRLVSHRHPDSVEPNLQVCKSYPGGPNSRNLRIKEPGEAMLPRKRAAGQGLWHLSHCSRSAVDPNVHLEQPSHPDQ